MCTACLRTVFAVTLRLKTLAAVKFDWRIRRKRIDTVRRIVKAVLLPRVSGDRKDCLRRHFFFPARSASAC